MNRTNTPTAANGSNNHPLYSPMLTRKKFGRDQSKSKIWLLHGFLAAFFFTVFNYFNGQFKGNSISYKVAGSYVNLVMSLLIHFYQRCKARMKLRSEMTE